MNLNDRFKTRASYILGGIAAACFILAFLLDAHYSRNPQFPDPRIGRVISHNIKSRGVVYLTPDQYEPYRWLFGTMFVCALLIALIHAAYFILNWLRRPRE